MTNDNYYTPKDLPTFPVEKNSGYVDMSQVDLVRAALKAGKPVATQLGDYFVFFTPSTVYDGLEDVTPFVMVTSSAGGVFTPNLHRLYVSDMGLLGAGFPSAVARPLARLMIEVFSSSATPA